MEDKRTEKEMLLKKIEQEISKMSESNLEIIKALAADLAVDKVQE